MRSTRAAAAIARLKSRSANDDYSMLLDAGGNFYLTQVTASGDNERLSDPLELDAFVTFVNAYGPQTPKRISKLDVKFEAQLNRKK